MVLNFGATAGHFFSYSSTRIGQRKDTQLPVWSKVELFESTNLKLFIDSVFLPFQGVRKTASHDVIVVMQQLRKKRKGKEKK